MIPASKDDLLNAFIAFYTNGYTQNMAAVYYSETNNCFINATTQLAWVSYKAGHLHTCQWEETLRHQYEQN